MPIRAGEYLVGDDRFYPEEAPIKRIKLSAFEIDATEVTNAQFERFVEETGYVTRAEKGLYEPEFAHLPEEIRRPGSAVFAPPGRKSSQPPHNGWSFVEGASWKQPEGPGSSIEGMDHYPVVHVAYEDATAYARWTGRRLPTEAEWEAASRGDLVGASYAWGEKPPAELARPAANTWQGPFPWVNESTDGHSGIAPVACFEPNPYGLHDMIGNVWEWTSDPYYPNRVGIADPQAPASGYDPSQPGTPVGVLKGGSFLCSENYCARFRPAARHAQDLTLGASHIGFRTVAGPRL